MSTFTTVWLIFFGDTTNRKALFFSEADADAYIAAHPEFGKKEARLDSMQVVNLVDVDL